MPTIDDFVNHRWADANEALRVQDPEYMKRVEDLVKQDESRNHLLYIPLEAKPPFEVNVTPRIPLSTEWHKLFEACNEITRQADIVLIIAASLTSHQMGQAPNDVAGRLFIYNFRSFPIHVKTLSEWANNLIKRTAETYTIKRRSSSILFKRYRRIIDREIADYLGRIRISNVHATDDNWSRSVTAEQNWEPAVALGQTPRIAHDVLLYPQQGREFKTGKYANFLNAAEMILNGIGGVLLTFEQDLMNNYDLKYPMGPWK